MRKDIKNEIIEATIHLIEERGIQISDVKIQDICNVLGIGTGLINYHFQTKDNLISKCVQIFYQRAIDFAKEAYKEIVHLPPLERMRHLVKILFEQIDVHDNLTRVAFLTTITDPAASDLSVKAAALYEPIIQEYHPEWDSRKVKVEANLISLTLEGVFLRGEAMARALNLDYTDPSQRGELIDRVIDCYFLKD